MPTPSFSTAGKSGSPAQVSAAVRAPGRFLVEIWSPDEAGERTPAEGWRCTFNRRVGRQQLRLSCVEPAMVAESADGRILLLLYGEVYDGTGPDKKTYLLEQYRKLGPDFIRGVNGSFALLIVDEAEERLLAYTDRVNSKKVFYSRWRGVTRLSNALRLHPLEQFRPDETGLACYLSNGNLLNTRTLFEEVRTLERACLHRLVDGRLESRPYWLYTFHHSQENTPPDRLMRDLGDRIAQAVRVRVKADNFLSLSAGYDATTILGAMGSSLKLPGVRTFSYFHRPIRADSDEAIAAEMAAVYGYPHELVLGFDGSLAQVVARNAALGEGVCNFCDEVDAWTRYGEREGRTDAGLFVGEECFGGANPAPIVSDQDALKRAFVYPFRNLAWMKKHLGDARYRRWSEGVDAEIATLLKRAGHLSDYRDRRDFIFLDQRISQRMMPWREYYAGRYFSVENPFLDHAILDFMEGLPGELRRGKRFFKETVVKMYPELFRLPRARSSGYAGYWDAELPRQRAALAALLEEPGASRLDEFIPPEVTRSLLRSLPVHPLTKRLQTGVDFSLAALRKASGEAHRGRFATSGDVLQMIKRLLLLRQVLATKGSYHFDPA